MFLGKLCNLLISLDCLLNWLLIKNTCKIEWNKIETMKRYMLYSFDNLQSKHDMICDQHFALYLYKQEIKYLVYLV